MDNEHGEPNPPPPAYGQQPPPQHPDQQYAPPPQTQTPQTQTPQAQTPQAQWAPPPVADAPPTAVYQLDDLSGGPAGRVQGDPVHGGIAAEHTQTMPAVNVDAP